MIIVVAVAALLTTGGVSAEPAPSVEAGDVSLALVEAMKYSVANDPNVKLAQEAKLASFGAVDQNMGPFDPILGLRFSYDGGREYLTGAQYHAENQKRLLFRALATNLQDVSDDLFEQLGGEGFVWANCPAGLDFTTSGGTPICVSGRTQAIFDLYESMAEAQNLEDAAQALVDANRNAAANTVDILNINAYAQRINLRNIGTVPLFAGSLTTAFDLRLTKLFRNGIILEPGILLDGFQENWVGKPYAPSFGGKGLPDSVRSVLGVTLDIPLGKGRGKVATAAPENAAKRSAEAALADEAFAINLSVENTALAYWNLATSLTLLELLQETEAIQADLLEMGRTLVDADEYAEADLNFLRGRLELTRGRVASAEEDVILGRVNLGRVMGQRFMTVAEAPIAADPLPEIPAEGVGDAFAIEAMVDEAMMRRFDLAAARSRKAAAEILASGAAFNTKRRVDLQMAVGYAGLHEGGDTSKFGDLVDGWWEALSDFSAGPSFRLGLSFELPFKNRVARGESVQAHALQQQSRINFRDLERTVVNEIERLTGAMVQAIQEGRRREYSVARYSEALDSEIEIFRSGEGSSIDVILTQEELLNEQVQLVSARRTIAFLATQLSFEMGRIVDCSIDGEEVTVMAFYPVGDIASFASTPPSGGKGSTDGSE